MKTNMTIVIEQLRPYLGNLAEEFIAMQLSLVNRQYVKIDHGPNRLLVTFPDKIPHINEDDLKRFIEVLRESLVRVVGPETRNKIMVDMYSELCKHYLSS